MKTKSKIITGLITAPIAAFILLLIISFVYTPEKTKTNLESVEWLPKTASNINTYTRGGFGWLKIYNCKMSENHLSDYAKEQKWILEEKEKVYYTQHKLKPDLFLIEKALQYQHGTLFVTYDLKNEILYVTESHR